MGKSLVIVESPAKSKTINKFLGKDYTVLASMGHIMDLPKNKMGIDIKNNFQPEYVVIPEKRKSLRQLKKVAKDKEDIYLAPDPDREGEAISWHLANLLGRGKRVHRVTFNEITKQAVLEAFKNAHQLNMNLVYAQQARRILDRIVGYTLSPLLWRKVGRGLSAGRVQSVAVKLIVLREREIQDFVPQEYWEIIAELKKKDRDNVFATKLEKIDGKKPHISDKESADRFLGQIRKERFVVDEIKETEKKKNPQPPFITSKLQQEAFNKLRFSAQKTMRIAQQLYEGIELGKEGSIGLITYMRTDSVHISREAQLEAREYIIKTFGKEYCPEKPHIYKSRKTAQQAHEAIRPTVPLREPQAVKRYLTADQFKLYELIWKRFIASQMSSARVKTTTVDIKAGRFLFRASSTEVLFDGFMKLQDEQDKSKQLVFPVLSKGEELVLVNLKSEQHFTKPPPRYSDASLVKELEEKGIGRPSTYAPILQTIIERGYVRRERGYLHPTELGTIVTDLLSYYFSKILDEKFTAEMEAELDGVEEGRLDWVGVLRRFYRPYSFDLKVAQSYMKNLKREAPPTKEVCELCGKPMVIKWGRRGKFLSCSGFPACKNAKPLTTGIKCPSKCGGELIQRRSHRGLFYGCTNYPKCIYTTEKLPDNPQGEQ